MNIYFIYPKDFEPSNFHELLNLLKVKEVVNLIPEGFEVKANDYFCFEPNKDLSLVPQKPQDSYLSHIAEAIIRIIEFRESLSAYYEARDCGIDFDPPFMHSNARDFISNITNDDAYNLLVLIYPSLRINELVKRIYGKMYASTHSFDYEDKIPMILIRSWAPNPERNIMSVWKRIRRTDKRDMDYINDARPLTFAEKMKFSSGVFFPVTMDDMEGDNKYLYYGIHCDPLCYLYKSYVDSRIDDDMGLKIGLANLLLTEEAQFQMNEKLEELAEERREIEYQTWLHADEIDDRDYERETYEALGGNDYD
ncbi:MAG: hypothetical protein J6E48_00265 [Prevotella sp.]|nr:hypothetical protein [Prevotella sp.]